jgi:hypothetical protein
MLLMPSPSLPLSRNYLSCAFMSCRKKDHVSNWTPQAVVDLDPAGATRRVKGVKGLRRILRIHSALEHIALDMPSG